MEKLFCSYCGGDLIEKDGFYECAFCGNNFKKTVQLENEEIINLNRANSLRRKFLFNDSLDEYDLVLEKQPDNIEANWGAFLSEYGIEYVKDYDDTYKPTCHRLSSRSVEQSRYFEKLNDEYKEKAYEIDKIRASVFEQTKLVKPYDVFICYKKSEAGGIKSTPESFWARDIYEKLKYEMGLRVFFAEKSLVESNVDWEPHIYSALKSSKTMLVLASRLDNLNSPWVKNEWKRFVDFSKNDNTKQIRVVYEKFDPYLLPRELQNKQAINQDSGNWLANVCATFTPINKPAEPIIKRPIENSYRDTAFDNLSKNSYSQKKSNAYENRYNKTNTYGNRSISNYQANSTLEKEDIFNFRAKSTQNSDYYSYSTSAKKFQNKSKIIIAISAIFVILFVFIFAIASLTGASTDELMKTGPYEGYYYNESQDYYYKKDLSNTYYKYIYKNNIQYRYYTGTYKVSGYISYEMFSNKTYEPTIYIENELNDIPVVAIGEGGFIGNTAITSIEIPDTVSIIEANAFWDCRSLQKINLDNVRFIGDSAFYNCSSLTEVDLRGLEFDNLGFDDMGKGAFEMCTSLKSVNYSATKVSESMFKDCTQLSSFTFTGKNSTSTNSSSTKIIGDNAFENCSSLSSIYLPASLEIVGNDAFKNCNRLATAYINSLAIAQLTDNSSQLFQPAYNKDTNQYLSRVILTAKELNITTLVGNPLVINSEIDINYDRFLYTK